MIKKLKYIFLIVLLAFNASSTNAQKKLRVIVAGLSHDHVHGILNQFNKNLVTIVGIIESDRSLQTKYSKLYNLPDSLFSIDLRQAILLKKPDAVLAYNPVGLHLSIVQICAPLQISVMVEKPLAATLVQAKEIQTLANKYKIRILTNFETTWYSSYENIYNTIQKDSIGIIKKMVVHDGHQGPKEIGCSKEFLSWLTDPVLNGAGALNDFGCYGADLMTWLMHGAKPLSVTAITKNYKPEVYPKVDDDATILLEYPNAIGEIGASWNWPFSIKDLEVFGQRGYLHGLDKENVFSRQRENIIATFKTEPLIGPYSDPTLYLQAVLQNKISGRNDKSSLEYNMIVMEILDAAKRSAASGRKIVL